MKARISKLPVIAAIAVTLSLCAGCNEQTAEAEENLPAASRAEAEITAADDADLAAPAVATNAPDAKVVQRAEAPKNLKISPALEEVVKLVQAGVSEEIILSYVTNTAQPFNLGSDEIIYLNDLGVSAPVLGALVQHESLPAIMEKKRMAAAEPLPPGAAVTPPATHVYPTATAEAPAVSAPLNPPVDQPAQAVSVPYFYSSLAPYGNWVEVDGYGLCWQPTVAIVNSSWRPYADRGRWLWTDSGWYWYSDYSWGWAPFHYGRWASFPRLGWVWCPDTVWGPSWVTWRYTDDYSGWAPLPPRTYAVSGIGLWYRGRAVSINDDFNLPIPLWTFLPMHRLWDPAPHRYFASPSYVRGLHRDSTVINNYVVGNNNTIINNGIGRDRIGKITRSEIPKATLVDTLAPVGKLTRAENIRGSGSSLVVSRPRLPVEGSVAAIPPGNGIHRERGITVFPKEKATPKSLAENSPSNLNDTPRKQHRDPIAAGSTTALPPMKEKDAQSNRGDARVKGAESHPTAPAGSIIMTRENHGNRDKDAPAHGLGKLEPSGPINRSTAAPTTPGPRSISGFGSTEREINQSRSATPTAPVPIARTEPSRAPAAPAVTPRSISPGPLTPPAIRSQAPPPVRSEPSRVYTPPAARSYSPPAVRPDPPRAYTPPAVRSEAPRAYSPPVIRSEPPRAYSPPPAVRSEPPRSYSAPPPISAPAQSGRSHGFGGNGGGGGRGKRDN